MENAFGQPQQVSCSVAPRTSRVPSPRSFARRGPVRSCWPGETNSCLKRRARRRSTTARATSTRDLRRPGPCQRATHRDRVVREGRRRSRPRGGGRWTARRSAELPGRPVRVAEMATVNFTWPVAHSRRSVACSSSKAAGVFWSSPRSPRCGFVVPSISTAARRPVSTASASASRTP